MTAIPYILAAAFIVHYLAMCRRVRQQRRELDSVWALLGHRKESSKRTSSLMACALVLLSAASAMAVSDEAAASLDRQQFPREQWPYLYYYTTEKVDSPEDRRALDVALRLVIPSMSRQPVLENCLPVQVTPTCYRIHLGEPIDDGQIHGLGWDYEAWRDLLARYPYANSLGSDGKPLDLVLRGDWLLPQLTDAHESDSYYRLLFGGKAPKTRDEALKILNVNGDVGLQFGMIEGQSGVSKQGVRLIRNLATARGYAWGTQDVLKLDSDQDPLEQPENDFKHDGEEWIIGIPKTHMGTGTRGMLQVYFLANGQGGIVDRAPVDLVEDHTEFRGYREIRAAGSCFSCHTGGLNYPTRNDLRDTIAAGVDAYADYKNQQAIEAFHFADLEKEINRNNEDYRSIVQIACGCRPEFAAQDFRESVKRYDAPLSLSRAAYELNAEPEELKLALGLASASGVKLTARLSGLAHGRDCPREAFESHYLTVKSIYETWSEQ